MFVSSSVLPVSLYETDTLDRRIFSQHTGSEEHWQCPYFTLRTQDRCAWIKTQASYSELLSTIVLKASID